MTRNGITIRIKVADLRVMGRATQGVRLINVSDTDDIAAVTKVNHEDDVPETSTENSDTSAQDSSTDTSTGENDTPTDENAG
jgi:DNA gyrase subunit A